MIQRTQLASALALTLALTLGTSALPAKDARPATGTSSTAAANGLPGFGEVIEVNVINVDVLATDGKGRPVTGLQKGDFELLEDGKAVSLSNFETVVPGAATSPASADAASAAGAASPAAQDDALNLVVFFDNFNLRPPHRARVLRQLHEFLARQLGPADRVMLVSYDGGLHVRVPFTADRAVIERGLGQLETLVTHGDESDRDRRQAFDAMMAIQRDSLISPDPIPCPVNIVTPADAYAATRRHEVLQAVNGLTLLVNSLSGVPGRKAVLHVSDGLPLQPGEELFQFLVELCGANGSSGFGSTVPPRPSQAKGPPGTDSGGTKDDPDVVLVFDSTSLDARSYKAASQAPLDAQRYSVAKNLETLAAHANAHRVTLYTLQASGAESPEASDASYAPNERFYQFQSIGTVDRANRRDSLQMLADATGGRAILDANDPLPDLARMRADLASFYSLGFTPAHPSDGREHRLEVRGKRPGVHLRYRQSYRDKSTMEKVVDRTLAALFYGIDDNPLDLTIEVGEPVAEGNLYAVPVQLRIPLFKLAILNQRDDSSFKGKLRILVATRDEEGGTSPVRQVEVPLDIPRKEVLNAMGQYYLYTLTLKMRAGPQHVAVAVRDELAATSSYLSRPLTVGPGAASASAHP